MHLRIGHHLHTHLLVSAGELLGHVGVLDGHKAILHLDDRDLGAHVVVHIGKLDADGACAHDDELVRPVGLHHGLAVGDDLFAVQRKRRDLAGARAGRDDDVLALDGLGLADIFAVHVGGGLHLDLAAAQQRRLAHVDGDLVLLHQEADATIHLVGHAARALDDRPPVGRGRDARGREPVVLDVRHHARDFGAFEQGFGRDAADVEADAAELVFLDDGHREAELVGADRGLVAAGARADDDDVVGRHNGGEWVGKRTWARILRRGAGVSRRAVKSAGPWRGRLWRGVPVAGSPLARGAALLDASGSSADSRGSLWRQRLERPPDPGYLARFPSASHSSTTAIITTLAGVGRASGGASLSNS